MFCRGSSSVLLIERLSVYRSSRRGEDRASPHIVTNPVSVSALAIMRQPFEYLTELQCHSAAVVAPPGEAGPPRIKITFRNISSETRCHGSDFGMEWVMTYAGQSA
jgi:hypothetical protein